MRIAFFADEKEKLKWGIIYFKECRKRDGGLTVDYYRQADRLLEKMDRFPYDLVIIFGRHDSEAGHYLSQKIREQNDRLPYMFLCGDIEKLFERRHEKYVSHFNGKLVTVDLNDISFLESLNRKTYIVTGSEKIRVMSRLDIEEQRLPAHQFVRINQGNIVNLYQIRSICGETICMKTGEKLYPSVRRKKDFLEKYQNYILSFSTKFDNETAEIRDETAYPIETLDKK